MNPIISASYTLEGSTGWIPGPELGMSDSVQEFFHEFSSQPASVHVEDPVSLNEDTMFGTRTYLSYRVILKQRGRDAVGGE